MTGGELFFFFWCFKVNLRKVEEIFLLEGAREIEITSGVKAHTKKKILVEYTLLGNIHLVPWNIHLVPWNIHLVPWNIHLVL